jgi:hypothetical protein
MRFDLGELTLPDDHYLKARGAQRPDRCRVTAPVPSELGDPEFAVRLRHSGAATPCMSMPETTVYKHGPTSRLIGEVGRARKGVNVLSIKEAEFSQGTTDRELGRGTRLTNKTEKTASARVRRDRFHSGNRCSYTGSMLWRCARTRSLNPSTNRRELRSVRDRNPLVAR